MARPYHLTNMVLDKWMFGKMPGGKFITNMLKGSSKEATQEGIQQIISNVAAEETDISVARLKKLLDPAKLSKGGISG